MTPLVLLAVACGAALVGASFRSGIEYGLLALLVAPMGIVAVAMPEGARRAEAGGVLILDGGAELGVSLRRRLSPREPSKCDEPS